MIWVLVILIALVVIVGLAFMFTYNGLVGLRNKIEVRTPRSTCSSTVGTISFRTWWPR